MCMAFAAVGQQSKDDQSSEEVSETGKDGLHAATRACSPAVDSSQLSKQTPDCAAAFSGHPDSFRDPGAPLQTLRCLLWLAC